MKFAIIYYSKTGHTREMAEVIARGLAAAGGETRFFSVEEAMDADYIDQCAGVIFGTPTYLANTCWQMKQWFDEGSRGIKLAGKLGGVFATAHYAQGGADVAIMTLLPHMLVKGMLVYSGGAAHGKPYIHLGPVALDAVGNHYEECKADFEIFGGRSETTQTPEKPGAASVIPLFAPQAYAKAVCSFGRAGRFFASRQAMTLSRAYREIPLYPFPCRYACPLPLLSPSRRKIADLPDALMVLVPLFPAA